MSIFTVIFAIGVRQRFLYFWATRSRPHSLRGLEVLLQRKSGLLGASIAFCDHHDGTWKDLCYETQLALPAWYPDFVDEFLVREMALNWPKAGFFEEEGTIQNKRSIFRQGIRKVQRSGVSHLRTMKPAGLRVERGRRSQPAGQWLCLGGS